MYRGIFTVGVAVTSSLQNSNLISANVLTDYSYINARSGDRNGGQVARCVTGLGPTGTSIDANDILGGLYFNGNKIAAVTPPALCSDDSVIQVRLGTSLAGVFNFHQCDPFTTATEGVYTCALMNSAMMNESVRFGIYLSGRSESLNL